MAEHKKLSMLVKLDDGQTYTLGGDGADNAVTLDTEQTITGLKTFDKLPQSSVEPANDHDLVNKVYVDALKPKLKTTVMLNVESESTTWAAFHSIKFSTTTGKFIEPVYLEDTLTSTAVEPLKFVFKLADSFTGNATAKNKDFFKDYQLKDGEYFGSFTPSHLLEARWSTHTNNEQANPFSNYLAYLTTGPNSVLPFLEYHFDGLSDELKQVEFYIGDIYNSNAYPPEKFQFVVSTGAKEFTSKVYTRAADSIGQGSHHTVEFKLKALEYVTLDTKQEIAGSKTFSENIKVTAKPKESTDVATVGYVSGLLNAKAPCDVTLDFKVEDDTDGGWVVYSNMEINLDNGKKLKCIHIDNTQPTSANAPVKAVFKAIPATEAINAAPTEQAPTFFDTYQLQDEEYLGTLTYGHILNSQLQDYASYKGPFHTNQYGTTCTIKEATQLRISISELPAAVSKVSLKFDSSYLPKTFKASLSGVGMDVTSNVLTNPSGNTPLELLFDVVKLTGLVTLDTAQTITGAKTFEKLPKSEATPVDDHELVNKKYVDSVCPQPLQGYEVTLYATAKTGNSHVGINGLTLFFGNGQKLVPAIIEGANDYSFAPSDARIIWTLDTSVVAKQVAKTEIDQHVLVDGEIDGRIQASYTLGGKFTNNKYDQFFMGGQMRLGSAGVTDEQPFAKLIVKGPIAPITKITLTSDYEADKIPASVRATVCQIGGEIKESKPVSITAINQNVELTLEKTFEPDSYYVNRFDDQDVLGVKKFGSVPTIKKNNALYGIGRSDTPALFGDLSGSIALPVPQKQMLNIAFGTKTTQNGIGSNATYTHVTSAVVGALKLKIRRPNDLVEEELYLKAHGPSTNGYRGILTNKKPSNYPNQIEVMDQSTMDGYKLKVGEYFTKLAFNSSTSENAWQDKLLEQAEKSGSNMLPNVFAASASTFFTHTNTDKFGNGSASVAFRLFIYDCPMITSWAYDDQSAESSGSSISLYSGDGSRNKGYTQENILNNHFAKDIPELNMQTTNVLAAIAALEARIKALEDAAPKP